MPETPLVLFADADGTVPLLRWLDGLEKVKARDRCVVRIERLARMGHELRRPDGDYLRDGIYELRVAHEGVQYRILYFFCGGLIVLSHGFVKEKAKIPKSEINAALKRKAQFERDAIAHTYRRWES